MAGAGVDVGSHKPSPTKYTGPPMDLANMRQNGVRALLVWCLACRHEATVNVDDQPSHLAVPSFKARFRCSQCNGKCIEVRPAWTKESYVPRS